MSICPLQCKLDLATTSFRKRHEVQSEWIQSGNAFISQLRKAKKRPPIQLASHIRESVREGTFNICEFMSLFHKLFIYLRIKSKLNIFVKRLESLSSG